MPDLNKNQLTGILDNRVHMERVRNLLNIFVIQLLKRGEEHDQSKIVSPEMEKFAEASKLGDLSFDTPEYAASKEQLADALAHHYANNRHHPEHFKDCESGDADLIDRQVSKVLSEIKELDDEEDKEEIEDLKKTVDILQSQAASMRSSVNNMNLLDVDEMFADWKASSERQKDGNLRKSIEVAGQRFGLSPQLVRIFENSVDIFG